MVKVSWLFWLSEGSMFWFGFRNVCLGMFSFWICGCGSAHHDSHCDLLFDLQSLGSIYGLRIPSTFWKPLHLSNHLFVCVPQAQLCALFLIIFSSSFFSLSSFLCPLDKWTSWDFSLVWLSEPHSRCFGSSVSRRSSLSSCNLCSVHIVHVSLSLCALVSYMCECCVSDVICPLSGHTWSCLIVYICLPSICNFTIY